VATRTIVTIGHPVLRQRAKKIHHVDESVKQLAQDLIDTVSATPNGAGLAANQIAVPLRALVTYVEGKPRVFINPEVLDESEEEEEAEEGCLSIPGWYGPVWRKERVTVRALNEKGKSFKVKASDFEARVLQHEIDHLNGVLFIDRMDDKSRLHRVESDDEEEELEEEQVFA
jgi:peptide deformylase